MKFIRFDDWRKLRGAEVEIWLDSALQRTGIIDEATEDSTMAWVAADSKEPRRLLERASGFELRISFDELVLRAGPSTPQRNSDL
ncbi:MAG: hypothetical protein ABI568_08725 [Pseudarthrobacter sp.]